MKYAGNRNRRKAEGEGGRELKLSQQDTRWKVKQNGALPGTRRGSEQTSLTRRGRRQEAALGRSPPGPASPPRAPARSHRRAGAKGAEPVRPQPPLGRRRLPPTGNCKRRAAGGGAAFQTPSPFARKAICIFTARSPRAPSPRRLAAAGAEAGRRPRRRGSAGRGQSGRPGARASSFLPGLGTWQTRRRHVRFHPNRTPAAGSQHARVAGGGCKRWRRSG